MYYHAIIYLVPHHDAHDGQVLNVSPSHGLEGAALAIQGLIKELTYAKSKLVGR